ncbi:MAG: lipid A deacylase LpxR family protein [Bacteroidetes bacterium]|nr:lipid A deacylase LpxR family protein [Bacteroidota bacterium]
MSYFVSFAVKKIKFILLLSTLACVHVPVRSQNSDSSAPALLRSLNIRYDNDVFVQTDYYYTQGSFIEMNFPFLKKNPLSKILLKCSNGNDESFGILYGQQGFTPTSIHSDTILRGDRPFAGTLYLGLDRNSANTEKEIRMKSEIDIGVLGPAAYGYESQKFIHQCTNNPEPHGWQYQVKNALMLNYSLIVQKELIRRSQPYDVFKERRGREELIGYGSLHAGTVNDYAGIGILDRIGFMNDYFDSPGRSQRVQCWIFTNAEARVVAYDGTLRGGFLNPGNAYVISADDLTRGVFQLGGGIGFAVKKIHLEFSDQFISPEFRTGRSHGWGHVDLAFVF